LSSSAFRLVKALAAESESPRMMPRALSCSLCIAKLGDDQFRVSLEHDLIIEIRSRWSAYHFLLGSLQLV
jgi:hypothetical protein